MFFLLPWGHDQPVYERPWVTYTLIAMCCVAHLLGYAARERSEHDVYEALSRFEEVSEAHPDAHISFPVNGLPSRLDRTIRPLVDTSRAASTPEDRWLEASVMSLVAAINTMPSFRYGWRSGAPTPMRLVTHMFMHADVFHLGGNMLLLWIAGGLLECFWRRWAFILLYVLSGFGGLIAFSIASPHSLTPLIGASGAIAGLMGAFVVGYPRVRIKLFWFSMMLLRPRWGTWLAPAWAVLPLWAGLELFKALLDMDGEGGVAYWGHVGGFAFGALAALAAKRFHLVAEDAGYDRAGAPEPLLVIPGTVRPVSKMPPPRPSLMDHLPLPSAAIPERPVQGPRPPPRDLELSDLREPGDDVIER